MFLYFLVIFTLFVSLVNSFILIGIATFLVRSAEVQSKREKPVIKEEEPLPVNLSIYNPYGQSYGELDK